MIIFAAIQLCNAKLNFDYKSLTVEQYTKPNYKNKQGKTLITN